MATEQKLTFEINAELAEIIKQLQSEKAALESEVKELREALKESLRSVVWQYKSTTNYLNDFNETTGTEPKMFERVKELEKLIEKDRNLLNLP